MTAAGGGTAPGRATAAGGATAFARVVADELARCGVADAVLAPGSRSAPLALAFHDEPGLRLHVQIDERSAAFTAVGLGKATGRPAVVLCTSGTAAANFHPAVLEAHESRTPLLVLTADRPPELRHAGANQTVDQIKLYGSAVRWFVEVGVPEALPGSVGYWRSVAAQAVAACLGPPAGPVHANVALREPLAPDPGIDPSSPALAGRDDGRAWTAVRRPAPAVDAGLVDRMAARIGGTGRGVLVVGDTTADPRPLLDLAVEAAWPVLAEPLSGARAGPNAISAYHALLAHPAFAGAHRPDVVVRVGRTVLSRALDAWLSPDVPQVLVDPDGAWLDPGRRIGEIVPADPAALAARVAAALPGRGGSPWLESWRGAEARARAAIDGLLDDEARPTEPRTARDLAAAAPDGSTLVVASSMPVRDLDQTMAPRPGLRVLGNRGASGIDGFVSTALGVALSGSPGEAPAARPTLALAGDLSVLHDQNGLLLAERVDLPVVVVNNDGGGIFSLLPQYRELAGDGAGGGGAPSGAFERVLGTPHGVDFGRLAGVYGAGHTRVEAAADLVPAVDAARAAGGVHLVEVRTDRAHNAALHARLLAAVAAAID